MNWHWTRLATLGTRETGCSGLQWGWTELESAFILPFGQSVWHRLTRRVSIKRCGKCRLNMQNNNLNCCPPSAPRLSVSGKDVCACVCLCVCQSYVGMPGLVPWFVSVSVSVIFCSLPLCLGHNWGISLMIM